MRGMSYTILILYLFHCFCYLFFLDSVMPWHLFHVPHPISSNLCHSILPQPFCPSSSVNSIPYDIPSSILSTPLTHLLSSIPCITSSFHIPSSLPLACFPSSMFHCYVSIFTISTSVHYLLPPHSNFHYLSSCPLWLCKSFSTFSIPPHSPYYSKPVAYKFLWLVVSSLACNCHYYVITLSSPPIVPCSFLSFSPSDNTIPLYPPCLSPLKLRTTLFSSEGATHKLKPSPYTYAVVLCIPYSTLHTPHSILPTSPPYLPDSGIASTSSFSYFVP